MNTLNRADFVKTLNEYAFNDDIHAVVECLNTLLEDKNYYENLDLIFMAIASTQLYGFLSYLTNEEQLLFFKCDYLRSNSYKGIEIPFYNRGQLSFLYELKQNKKVFFSAPTSFGKTSIVIEYILNNAKSLNNIMFVVPTNSLLEELFDKFTVYNSKLNLNYNISTQPIQLEMARNILLLTPERFMEMAQSNLLNNFDLIIMDETYKIVDAQNESISDFVNHRAVRFRKVADLIAGTNTRIIFLSPFTYTLTQSMSDFLSKYEIKKIDRKLEYVKREIILAENSANLKNYFGCQIAGYRKDSSIPQKVKFILSKLRPNSSIVYVPNYSEAYKIASVVDFCCINQNGNARYKAFLNHIRDNFLVDGKESWTVFEALKNGIGIYISPLPRYIKKEMIRLYEAKILSVLIVTTAFTEGVNTCASDLIFTSLVNGPNKNKLSDIDILNVSGRAGRFAKNTVGRIFCITKEVFDRVKALQKANDVKLENYNYKIGKKRLDYEIEMMDEKYLSDEQRNQLKYQKKELEELGLSKEELNISLNVSNNWKIILYKHFMLLDNQTILEVNKNITAIFDKEDGEKIPALSYIFKDLNIAFSKSQVSPFPQEPYEISPFDKSGEFTWGRLYQIYVSGSPKKIIANNVKFISAKFLKITNGYKYTNKKQVNKLFETNNAAWILKYYNNDLSLKMNTFYTETFKIVSNIIQYKIPFYLSFYVSVFKLFVQKLKTSCIDKTEFDISRLINIFEDGDVSGEYSKLIDCGLPITTVEKISDNNISIDELKSKKFDQSKFDDYEKIIISEIVMLL